MAIDADEQLSAAPAGAAMILMSAMRQYAASAGAAPRSQAWSRDGRFAGAQRRPPPYRRDAARKRPRSASYFSRPGRHNYTGPILLDFHRFRD